MKTNKWKNLIQPDIERALEACVVQKQPEAKLGYESRTSRNYFHPINLWDAKNKMAEASSYTSISLWIAIFWKILLQAVEFNIL